MWKYPLLVLVAVATGCGSPRIRTGSLTPPVWEEDVRRTDGIAVCPVTGYAETHPEYARTIARGVIRQLERSRLYDKVILSEVGEREAVPMPSGKAKALAARLKVDGLLVLRVLEIDVWRTWRPGEEWRYPGPALTISGSVSLAVAFHSGADGKATRSPLRIDLTHEIVTREKTMDIGQAEAVVRPLISGAVRKVSSLVVPVLHFNERQLLEDEHPAVCRGVDAVLVGELLRGYETLRYCAKKLPNNPRAMYDLAVAAEAIGTKRLLEAAEAEALWYYEEALKHYRAAARAAGGLRFTRETSDVEKTVETLRLSAERRRRFNAKKAEEPPEKRPEKPKPAPKPPKPAPKPAKPAGKSPKPAPKKPAPQPK